MKLTTALALSFTSAAVASTSHAGAAHGLLKRSASHSGSENRLVRRSRSAHQQYARQAEAALSPVPSPANASHLAMPTTTYNGTALWFNQTAGKQGACLQINTDDDFVVGLSTQFWNDTTVPSPLCGDSVFIRNPANGANITATVADASGKFEYTTLTIGAFRALGVELATGMFAIEYTFLNSTHSNSSSLPASLSAVTFAGVPGNVRVAPANSTSDSTPSSTSTTESSTTASSTTQAAASPSVDVTAQAAARASAAAAQASRDAQGARDAQAARDAQGARDAQAARDAQGARDAAAAAAAKAASDKAAADARWAAEQAEKNKPAPGGGGGDTHSGGHATFYYQNGVTGACGAVGQDSDLIAAMDSRLYQRTPNGRSSLCDRRVRITRPDNGKSVTVRVADECPTCISANSIDLSVAAFRMIALEAEGLVPITWQFV